MYDMNEFRQNRQNVNGKRWQQQNDVGCDVTSSLSSAFTRDLNFTDYVDFALFQIYGRVMDPEILNPNVIMDSIYGIFDRIDYQFDIRKKIQLVKDYAYAHPFWATFVLMTVAVLTVPVGAFVLFAGGTIAFTFVGFIFVEGRFLDHFRHFCIC
jgi:hypothetical protein